jgi:hypothetical protein
MKTTERNFAKAVKSLINGTVVAASTGDEFIATDINNPESYVWCGSTAKLVDWPLEGTIEQDSLLVPDHNGDHIEYLCRYQKNPDTCNPYVGSDFEYIETQEGVGFVKRR